jgi:hypothetical protein
MVGVIHGGERLEFTCFVGINSCTAVNTPFFQIDQSSSILESVPLFVIREQISTWIYVRSQIASKQNKHGAALHKVKTKPGKLCQWNVRYKRVVKTTIVSNIFM